MRACANHLSRCNYRARPRQASGLNGYEAARGSSEARDFTPERTPRHSILDVPVSVRRGNNRYGEGTRPPARRPPLGQVRPVLGSAPAAVPGPWVGARQWPFLGSVPPLPSPAPARPRRRQPMGPPSPDHRWTAQGMDGGRKSPCGRASCSRYAARAARSAVCIVAIRVARERSKKLRRRPQGAGRCKHSAHERKRL